MIVQQVRAVQLVLRIQWAVFAVDPVLGCVVLGLVIVLIFIHARHASVMGLPGWRVQRIARRAVRAVINSNFL